MAHPKPRRPRPARGLPPAHRPTPEEAAEIARLRAELEFNCIRIDAILIEKRAEAAERARIRAEREAEVRETQAKASAPSSTSATPAGRGRESPTVSSLFHGEVARSGAERRRGS